MWYLRTSFAYITAHASNIYLATVLTNCLQLGRISSLDRWPSLY